MTTWVRLVVTAPVVVRRPILPLANVVDVLTRPSYSLSPATWRKVALTVVKFAEYAKMRLGKPV